MKLITIFLFLSWTTFAFSQPKKLFPEFPTGGIGLAQIFDSKVADPAQYQANASKVYYIWGATSPNQPAGVIASKYFPSMRTPDKNLSIEWYKKNHPDWIMYQADKITPAYGYIYDYGGLTPLDISNPQVRDFYLEQFIMPAINKGYRMVAMDNTDLSNWPKSVGHYKGKEWVQLYTGRKDDPMFHKAVTEWMQYLSAKLHPLGVRVSANIKATTASPEVVLKVIETIDMWLDETGFCHRGVPITGEEWKNAFKFLQKVTPNRGYVSINQVKGPVSEASTEQIEWVLANYLLHRGQQSLVAFAGYDKSAIYHHFDYRREMDINIGSPVEGPKEFRAGIWGRAYSNGLTLVNPSANETISVTLPNGKWKTIYGGVISGELALKPATGAVLTKL